MLHFLKIADKSGFFNCLIYMNKTVCWNMVEPGEYYAYWSKSNRERQILYVIAAAKSLQSCPTLCDPIDGSSPDSPIPGILQARTLEWVAIFFSNTWKWKVKVKSLSHVWPFGTPWTVAYQAPPPMGCSRQEYWSGVPLPFLALCILTIISLWIF